jgi:Na+-driven multidrug efflux pump
VERVAWIGALYALLFTGLPILVLQAVDPWVLLAFLKPTSPSLPIAIHINNIVLWGFIPFGVAFIFSGIVRATGAVWPPLIAMIISLWAVRVPLAKLMEPHLGADAIWIAFPIGSGTTLLLAGSYYFYRGPLGWRRARMLHMTPSADAPDTGLGQPMMDESEAITDAEQREISRQDPNGPSPSEPNRPRSEAPAE